MTSRRWLNLLKGPLEVASSHMQNSILDWLKLEYQVVQVNLLESFLMILMKPLKLQGEKFKEAFVRLPMMGNQNQNKLKPLKIWKKKKR